MLKNKSLVISSASSYLVATLGYAIAPDYGTDSLSLLLIIIGMLGWVVFGIWCWVRLWKSQF